MAVKDQFLKFYNLALSQGKGASQVIPSRPKGPALPGQGKLSRPYTNNLQDSLPTPRVQQMWDYYMHQCHDSAQSFQNRQQMYMDMEMLFYNNSYYARAMKLHANEAVPVDSSRRIFDVEGPPDQKKYVLEFIKRTEVEQIAWSTAFDVVQFGDAVWIPFYKNGGIDSFQLIDVFDLQERMEFSPIDVQKKINNKGSGALYRMYQDIDKMRHLVTAITADTNEHETMFKSYLLGFVIADMALPPWRCLHFRNLTTRSPFKPYGMPTYIHGVAPYRQYDAGMNLQVVARGAQFPMDHWKIKGAAGGDPVSKLETIWGILRRLDNIGEGSSKREGAGIGDRNFSIEGMLEYEQISPRFDIKGVDDLEMMENNIIVSTGLPRNLLDPNNGSFGNSGVALIQQYRPFRRDVYRTQSVIMEQLIQAIKLDMIASGKYSLEQINFQITMPFPDAAYDRDAVSSQSDLLRLANDYLDALSNRILGSTDTPLPPELIHQVYSKFLPLDDTLMKQWMGMALQQQQAKYGAADPAMAQEAGYADYLPENARAGMQIDERYLPELKSNRKKLNEIGRKGLYEAVEQTFYEMRHDQKEGSLQNEHYMSSRRSNREQGFAVEQLVDVGRRAMNEAVEKSEELQALNDEQRRTRLPLFTPKVNTEEKSLTARERKKYQDLKAQRYASFAERQQSRASIQFD